MEKKFRRGLERVEVGDALLEGYSGWASVRR